MNEVYVHRANKNWAASFGHFRPSDIPRVEAWGQALQRLDLIDSDEVLTLKGFQEKTASP